MADEEKKQEENPELLALKESVAKLEAKNRELLEEKATARKAAEKAAEESAKKSGDVEALEKSWSEKLNAALEEKEGKIAEYQKMVNNMTVVSQAQKMASDLALPGSADVLLPHIERRLAVEMQDGSAIVRVLDKSGRPSAMSVEDLRKEISGDKAFAPLLLGSKANGAGGAGGKGSPESKTMLRSGFDNLGPKEQMEFVKGGGRPVDS